MVEFALSSVVLLLIVGGLVDIGRAIYVSEIISSAAREGARHGAWFDAPNLTHPYLYDAPIQAAVDLELKAMWPAGSVLKISLFLTYPATTDSYTYHNPPYANSASPTTANQPWLYIC